jgi:hypothetical protein
MDYIIIKEDKTPLCFDDNSIVVYGDKHDALEDLAENDFGLVEIEYDGNAATLYFDGEIVGWFEYDTNDEDDYQSKLKESVSMMFLS